jgi:hypothetical protein
MPLRTLFYSVLLAFISLISPAISLRAAIAHENNVELPELPNHPITPTSGDSPSHPPKLPVIPVKKPTTPTKPPELPKPTKAEHPSKPPKHPVTPAKKPAPTKPEEINITKAEFGVFRRDKHGKINFIPTRKVPLEEGLAYGWRLQIKDYQGEVTWKEIFRLPQLPLTWGTQNGENFSLSNNGSAAITTRTTEVEKGIIKNSWTVTPGDPPGNHLIEVFFGDRHVASFEFEIVKPKPKTKKPKD